MNKKQLIKYCYALHWVLEREFTEVPKTVKELRAKNKELEERLRHVPSGEASIKEAQSLAEHTSDMVFGPLLDK